MQPDHEFTMNRQLCDDDGYVSDTRVAGSPNLFDPELTYLRQINNLRAHTGLPPVAQFRCTGSAHLAGEHIRCTSPAHMSDADSWWQPRYYVAAGVAVVRSPRADRQPIHLAAGDSLAWTGPGVPEVVDGQQLIGPMTKEEYDTWRLRDDSFLYPSAIVGDDPSR